MADDLPVGCRGCDRYHRHARYDCDDCIDLAGAGTTKRKPCRSCGEYKYLGHFESRVKCQSCLTLSPAKVASLSCSHVQHTRTRTQTHIYTRHTHTHIHTHTHKHTHTHTHTDTQTQTHTYTHLHTATTALLCTLSVLSSQISYFIL